jgi:hypothetical protein
MTDRRKYHIVPSPDGGWKVKAEGAARASSLHNTQNEAIEAARLLAQKRRPSQIMIHGRDGRFLREYTYGQDPFPPKG